MKLMTREYMLPPSLNWYTGERTAGEKLALRRADENIAPIVVAVNPNRGYVGAESPDFLKKGDGAADHATKRAQ
jgi:hypothetical protein